jgi:hypothetical protein
MGFNQSMPSTKPKEEVKIKDSSNVDEPLIQEVPYVMSHASYPREERT